ncbi:phosphate-binding protein [Paenibacillus mucilaginosus 3016]|uniref:Phosphate-binding protein n=1 Tax=Paenibacillus mucilaginosus 3016 TaxID=1116391 RepID=H6NBK1_9BACL|nr:substrate-binding domain-containing protein [Paenibacillus mucilaginosus]AFC33770.1 phosphate-binding protein [Paenibacillus mucilaginosus 3016]WFA22165.1 phosphate-binding protein [Paenibacillus mucilaginosus]
MRLVVKGEKHIESEVNLKPDRKDHRGIGFVLQWGFLFGVMYLLGILIAGFLTGSEPEFLYRSLKRGDAGVGLLMLLYSLAIACLFGLYGYASGRQDGVMAGRQVLAVLPVTLLGTVIWTLTFTGRTGSVAEFTDMSWLPFTLFTYWATPLYEASRFYVDQGTPMKVAALVLSLLPGVSAVLGTWLHQAAAGNPRRLRRLLLPLAVLSVLTGGMALTLELLPKQRPFTPQSYPRVDGATAALPFGRLMLGELTGVNRGMAYESVHFNTTHEAYLNLIEREADLILVAGPSNEERQQAAAAGVELKLTPLGRDAFIFLVHRENGVDGVKAGDLRRIYSGEVTNWKELGGADEPITAFQREANSGSQTYMEKNVMKGLGMAEPPMDRKPSGMGGLIEAVADYRNARNALGYSFYYYASEMNRSENVKFLAVDGVQPSRDNIRSGAYPYTAVLYAVTRGDEPADSPAGRLLQWLQSEAGAQAVERGGFVPGTGTAAVEE